MTETTSEIGEFEGTFPLDVYRFRGIIGLRLGRNRKDFGPLRQGIAAAGYQRPLGFEGDR